MIEAIMAPEDIGQRPPDPFVARHAGAGTPGITIAGLLGDSDRPGCRRLYLTTRLDYFVEFRTEDVVAVDSVAPDEPPFVGLDATRVTLAENAVVDWVTRQRVSPDDAFVLDPRTRAFPVSDRRVLPEFTGSCNLCLPNSFGANCPEFTRPASQHCGTGETAVTFTRFPTNETCGQDTCATCGDATCVTCPTCDTCAGPRCVTVPNTCFTCGQATCLDCPRA